MKLLRRAKISDGYVRNCTKPCNNPRSFRVDNVLEHSKLILGKIIRLIYMCKNRVTFLNITYDLEVDRKTVGTFGFICKDCIIEDVINNNRRLGGTVESGIPKVVEVDESLFIRAKYNRGNHASGQWYVGGIERGSKNACLVPVHSKHYLLFYK